MPAPDFLQAYLVQPLPDTLDLSSPFPEKTLNCVVLSSYLSFQPRGRKFTSLLRLVYRLLAATSNSCHCPLVICSEIELPGFIGLLSSPSFLHSPAKLEEGICTRMSHNPILEDFHLIDKVPWSGHIRTMSLCCLTIAQQPFINYTQLLANNYRAIQTLQLLYHKYLTFLLRKEIEKLHVSVYNHLIMLQ